MKVSLVSFQLANELSTSHVYSFFKSCLHFPQLFKANLMSVDNINVHRFYDLLKSASEDNFYDCTLQLALSNI